MSSSPIHVFNKCIVEIIKKSGDQPYTLKELIYQGKLLGFPPSTVRGLIHSLCLTERASCRLEAGQIVVIWEGLPV